MTRGVAASAVDLAAVDAAAADVVYTALKRVSHVHRKDSVRNISHIDTNIAPVSRNVEVASNHEGLRVGAKDHVGSPVVPDPRVRLESSCLLDRWSCAIDGNGVFMKFHECSFHTFKLTRVANTHMHHHCSRVMSARAHTHTHAVHPKAVGTRTLHILVNARVQQSGIL